MIRDTVLPEGASVAGIDSSSGGTFTLEGNVTLNAPLNGTVTVAQGANVTLGENVTTPAEGTTTITLSGDATISNNSELDNSNINAKEGAEVEVTGGTGTVTTQTESSRVGVNGKTFAQVVSDATSSVLFTDDTTGGTYNETSIGTVTATKGLYISGQTNTVTLSGMTFSAADNAVIFKNLTCDGRIYGGKFYNTTGTAAATDVCLDNVTMTSLTKDKTTTYSRIYGGASAAASNIKITGGKDISLSINLASGSTVGNVYGGGSLSQTDCTYNLGTVTTTISGSGYFKYYVGNGTQANSSCSVTQGASTLNISGGTFASFVYAGGYNQASQSSATSVQCGNTTLNITGGTFCSNVFGGCVAASDISYAQYTTVNGSCSVTVDTSETNTVIFGRNLIAGSNGTGDVTGGTTLTFTGLGSNLSFSGTSAGTGYVMGGCTGDKGRENSPSAVDGERKLAFDDFSGNFGANARNSFDTISFSGSSVTFTGSREVDLRGVDTWEFDISDDKVDLTWTSTDCDDAENNFAGDQLVITGSITDSKVLMSGDDTTLNGWTSIDSLVIGGSTYTNKGQTDNYVKFGTDTTENYKLIVDSGKLTLTVLA